MQVLFMCTANSCRSVLCEGLFNQVAPTGMTATSSGSFPSGHLNPRAISTLQSLGVDTAALYSKGSESFANNPPDIVITVCDKAGGEPCPVYFGSATKSHWGLSDPSEIRGDEEVQQAAFESTVAKIRQRFDALFSLDISSLNQSELKQALDRIGAL